MRKFAVGVLAFLLASWPFEAFSGPPVLWGAGDQIKALQNGINFNDNVGMLAGNWDPSAIATCAPRGSLFLRYGAVAGYFQKQDNGCTVTWTAFVPVGGGIISINGLNGVAQALAVGTAGADFNIADAGVTHTFNLPTASAVNRGALSSADWTTFNNKLSVVMNALGDTMYGGALGVNTRLAGNTTTTPMYLKSTGDGVNATAPAWSQVALSDTSGTLPINRGGTGQTTANAAFNALSPMTTIGDIIYGGAAGAATRLAGNTTTTKMFCSSTGDGVNATAPAWAVLLAADIPNLDASKITTGQLSAARGGTGQDSSAWTGVAHVTAGVWSASAVNLASDITGVLPIANGGTNSSSVLNNNRIMVSSGGAIVENGALIGSAPMRTTAGGLPTTGALALGSEVSGTLPILNGGTGQTTANAAFNALAPSQGGNNGKVLGTNGTDTSWVSALTNTLTDAHIFVGNGSNVATDVAMSGDVAISNTGVTTIQPNAITNTEVDAAAAIARSKLASGSANHVLINDGSGVMSSEAQLSLTRTARGTADYVLKGNGVGADPSYALIVNANVDAAAAIARSKIATGTANHVVINDGTGALSGVAPGSAGNVLTSNGVSWVSSPGGGGGNGASLLLEWVEDNDSPPYVFENNMRVYDFIWSGDLQYQKLYTAFKVPAGYSAGRQIFLKTVVYSAESASRNSGSRLYSYLVRTGTDLASSTTNVKLSALDINWSAATTGIPQSLIHPITDAIGQINSVAVSPGDLIRLKLTVNEQPGAGLTSFADVKFPVHGTEVTF